MSKKLHFSAALRAKVRLNWIGSGENGKKQNGNNYDLNKLIQTNINNMNIYLIEEMDFP